MIGGDGIGPEVVAEAVAVLESAGFGATWVECRAGRDVWLEEGEALPAHTVETVRSSGLALFGAVTSQPESVTAAEAERLGLSPWTSPILALRRRLGLDVSVRPATTFPGNPANPLRRRPDGGVEEAPVDVVVVRQNTEGLYAGVEWEDPTDDVRRVLSGHPRWPAMADDERWAVSVRLVSRSATRRLVRVALDLARARGEDRIVVAEKPNVLRATSGLVVDTALALAAEDPGIEVVPVNVDALVMDLVAHPDRYGVIATTNLFGDILSDAAAALVGGPGYVPSSNVGPTAAVFEPAHGSAPDIAGRSTANPIAAILAGAMLAEHVGRPETACRIRRGVAAAVAGGLPRDTAGIGAAIRRAVAGA